MFLILRTLSRCCHLRRRKKQLIQQGWGIEMRGCKTLAATSDIRPCGCIDAKSSRCVSIPQTGNADGSARHPTGSCKCVMCAPLVRNKFNLFPMRWWGQKDVSVFNGSLDVSHIGNGKAPRGNCSSLRRRLSVLPRERSGFCLLLRG